MNKIIIMLAFVLSGCASQYTHKEQLKFEVNPELLEPPKQLKQIN